MGSHRRTGAKPNPVGLIIEIKDSQFDWEQHQKYTVRWIGDGPTSRESYGYGYSRKNGYWHRTDLKFVAKAK